MGRITSRVLRRPRAAFTLAEVVITLAIIAVLSGLTIPTIRGRLEYGNANALVAELQNLQTAINTYKSDVGHYPHDLTYLAQLPTSGAEDACNKPLTLLAQAKWHGPYINRLLPTGTANYVLASGDTVKTTYTTTPITFSTTIGIEIDGVDSTVAQLVDLSIDGANNNGSGMLQWAPHSAGVSLDYFIPYTQSHATGHEC